MSNRTAKFLSTIFVSLLAGSNLVAFAGDDARTADNCLSGPKATAPAGSHWYYRVERGSKRHCWYVREENDSNARATPRDAATPPAQAAAPAAEPAPPRANAGVSKSIADAHAELPSPQARVEQDPAARVPQPTAGMATVGAENAQRASAPDTDTPSSLVATRWPDPSGVSSSNPRLAAADLPAGPQADAAPTPRAAASPIALATADASLQKQSGSTQMLLMVMAAALALAGITASLVFRFGRASLAQPEIRGDRRAIWDSIAADRSSPSIFPNEQIPMRRDERALDPRAPDDPDRRVKEMLARLARSTQ